MVGPIYAAVDPSGDLDLRGTSDATLARKLRATSHFDLPAPAAAGVVTAAHLAALDEARDYAAASAYNYLNAELAKLRERVRTDGPLRVEAPGGPTIISTLIDFDAWASQRYPHAQMSS